MHPIRKTLYKDIHYQEIPTKSMGNIGDHFADIARVPAAISNPNLKWLSSTRHSTQFKIDSFTGS
jgi:hypothetical protein